MNDPARYPPHRPMPSPQTAVPFSPTHPPHQDSPSYPGHALAVNGAPLSSPGKRLGAYLLEAVLTVVTLGIGWLIWSAIVWSQGQTPAKAVLGMRCVRTDTGRPATWGSMALRELVGKGIIGSITFGITTLVFCFMGLGDDRQTVWDKLATTIVIDER